MAYDEVLARRVRTSIADRDDSVDLEEKNMFGGLAFLMDGHMAVAVSGRGGLMVRCDPADVDDHLADGAERMVMRGKPMNGWLRVEGDQVADDGDLRRWVAVGVEFVGSMEA